MKLWALRKNTFPQFMSLCGALASLSLYIFMTWCLGTGTLPLLISYWCSWNLFNNIAVHSALNDGFSSCHN
jgi:hypothetical protein